MLSFSKIHAEVDSIWTYIISDYTFNGIQHTPSEERESMGWGFSSAASRQSWVWSLLPIKKSESKVLNHF